MRPSIMEPGAHEASAQARPGQGLVANEALMATAGAEPVVNPDPFEREQELPFEDTLLPRGALSPARLPPRDRPRSAELGTHRFDAEAEGGATGLETLEMGAGRVRVDDKKIINCRADLNQLVPFKYDWA
ncbi:MAG: hypothetical protein WAK53_11150, partial [Chromatiaceae bacterium]